MNTLILKIVVVLSALHFYLPSYAQQLTAEEKELLQTRVKNKVDEYQYYLKQLSDKLSTSRAVKDNAYTLALKLFIGEGENYEVFDEDLCRDVMKSAVRMEISSKYRSTKSRIMQKRYLINLRENRTYSQIEITDADVVRIDNIHRVGNHYECMAYFCQKFVGFRDKRIAYSDITTKKVRVIIQAIQIPKSDGSTETIWNALLGDIYVIETRTI